jgi:hypothetical protein
VKGEITGASTQGCYPFSTTAPTGTFRDCRESGRDLYAGGRIGVVVDGSTLLYGKLGYTNAHDHLDHSFTGTPASAFQGNYYVKWHSLGLVSRRQLVQG